MGKKPLLLVVECAEIERQIPKRLQCSQSLVHHAIEKCKKQEIYDDIKKTGRLHKNSQRDDHAIRMMFVVIKLSCNPPLVLVIKYMPIG